MTQTGIELIIREHKYNEKEKCYLQVQRDCFVYLKKTSAEYWFSLLCTCFNKNNLTNPQVSKNNQLSVLLYKSIIVSKCVEKKNAFLKCVIKRKRCSVKSVIMPFKKVL